MEDMLLNWEPAGRPGYTGKNKARKVAEYNSKYGEGNWKYMWEYGELYLDYIEECRVYEDGYYFYFLHHPWELNNLAKTASDVYDNAKSNVESGTDYSIQEAEGTHIQDISIRRVMKRRGKAFKGGHLVQIRGDSSEGKHLSPGVIPFHRPERIPEVTLEGKHWWLEGTIEDQYQKSKNLMVRKVA